MFLSLANLTPIQSAIYTPAPDLPSLPITRLSPITYHQKQRPITLIPRLGDDTEGSGEYHPPKKSQMSRFSSKPYRWSRGCRSKIDRAGLLHERFRGNRQGATSRSRMVLSDSLVAIGCWLCKRREEPS